jgi:hypothetical protein
LDICNVTLTVGFDEHPAEIVTVPVYVPGLSPVRPLWFSEIDKLAGVAPLVGETDNQGTFVDAEKLEELAGLLTVTD